MRKAQKKSVSVANVRQHWVRKQVRGCDGVFASQNDQIGPDLVDMDRCGGRVPVVCVGDAGVPWEL